ncbi:MAG: hypothetical protein K9J16_02205 [Melioribacteraceae bacterium]|nr:hypothetical protein [Melioribacteraceae bacterium]MCF8355152.1 hypothetical protein [Melioribacteraceae bacterium]MCF8392481.1 hypothetical protein [Melioribacteraceae bacterium]MCF8418392.1 hypothetical protein [Melioribacteraceae bacterium]
MRIHKENTLAAQPIFENYEESERNNWSNFSKESLNQNSKSNYNGYIHSFEIINRYQTDLEEASDLSDLFMKFETVLRRIIPIRHSGIFFLDENKLKFNKVEENQSDEVFTQVNEFYKEGKISPIFSTNKFYFFPDISTYNIDGNKRSFLLYPVKENGKAAGIFAGLTTIGSKRFTDLDRKTLQTIIVQTVLKIHQLTYKANINNTVGELQTYQAKVNEDFHLAAIGELSLGVFDEIASPLQVILSQADLLESESDHTSELLRIKTQVNKIKSMLNRLIKFASVEKNVQKLESVNLNEIIENVFEIIKSTLANYNIECVLDLEDNTPPILSSQHFIYQILLNVVELIKHNKRKNGGIIIQSRFVKNNVHVNVITTTKLRVEVDSDSSKNKDIRYKIINFLMKKHEGSFDVESHHDTGAKVSLIFPLLRKIRS